MQDILIIRTQKIQSKNLHSKDEIAFFFIKQCQFVRPLQVALLT